VDINEFNKMCSVYMQECLQDALKETLKEIDYNISLLRKEDKMGCKGEKPKAPRPKK